MLRTSFEGNQGRVRTGLFWGKYPLDNYACVRLLLPMPNMAALSYTKDMCLILPIQHGLPNLTLT